MGILEFNTALAKQLKRLKKDVGATGVRQNYRGTGSRKHRRQLYCRFPGGAVIDLWLEDKAVTLGGCVAIRPGGERGYPQPRSVSYGDQSPEAVYAGVLAALKPWLRTEQEEAEFDAMVEAYEGGGLVGLIDAST